MRTCNLARPADLSHNEESNTASTAAAVFGFAAQMSTLQLKQQLQTAVKLPWAISPFIHLPHKLKAGLSKRLHAFKTQTCNPLLSVPNSDPNHCNGIA